MDYKKKIRGKAIDTRHKAVWYNAYVLKYFEKIFLYLMGSGIDFPLVMNYKEDTRQETEDRRQAGLWSNVYSPKSLAENSSLGLGIRNLEKTRSPIYGLLATFFTLQGNLILKQACNLIG